VDDLALVTCSRWLACNAGGEGGVVVLPRRAEHDPLAVEVHGGAVEFFRWHLGPLPAAGSHPLRNEELILGAGAGSPHVRPFGESHTNRCADPGEAQSKPTITNAVCSHLAAWTRTKTVTSPRRAAGPRRGHTGRVDCRTGWVPSAAVLGSMYPDARIADAIASHARDQAVDIAVCFDCNPSGSGAKGATWAWGPKPGSDPETNVASRRGSPKHGRCAEVPPGVPSADATGSGSC
jgi:hypothetical protein